MGALIRKPLHNASLFEQNRGVFFYLNARKKFPHIVGEEDTKNIINNGLGGDEYNDLSMLKSGENVNLFIINYSILEFLIVKNRILVGGEQFTLSQ